MKLKHFALAMAFSPVFAHATPEGVMFFQCGQKVLTYYLESNFIFIDDTKTDDAKYLKDKDKGNLYFFKINAEQGGIYTQYVLTIPEKKNLGKQKLTLDSQLFNADDEALREADEVNCSKAERFIREAPTTLSVMERMNQDQG